MRYLYFLVGIPLVLIVLFIVVPIVSAILGFDVGQSKYKCGGIAGNVCPEGYACINPLSEKKCSCRWFRELCFY